MSPQSRRDFGREGREPRHGGDEHQDGQRDAPPDGGFPGSDDRGHVRVGIMLFLPLVLASILAAAQSPERRLDVETYDLGLTDVGAAAEAVRPLLSPRRAASSRTSATTASSSWTCPRCSAPSATRCGGSRSSARNIRLAVTFHWQATSDRVGVRCAAARRHGRRWTASATQSQIHDHRAAGAARAVRRPRLAPDRGRGALRRLVLDLGPRPRPLGRGRALARRRVGDGGGAGRLARTAASASG